MKKSIILAMFVALTVSMSAQHVTPIEFQLTDFNLESLRQEYQGSSYLLELQRLDKLMKDDTKQLKDIQVQLKEEKAYHKQMSAYVEKADASIKTLQTLSQKELDELKKVKENVDKQLNLINSSTQLNIETRTKAVDHLQGQRRSLEAAINATTARLSQLANHPVELQKMRTDLMVLSNELVNKETDLKQMDATLKTRREVIKSEMKNVKAQK